MMSPAPCRIATRVPTAAITPMQKIDTNE